MVIKAIDQDLIDLNNLSEASKEFDSFGITEKLGFVPWENYPYKPDVEFRIAYLYNKILLKFYVKEKEIISNHKNDNEMVCEDSCVEFFVKPGNSDGYYNFEFNSIGTVLVQYGSDRNNRKYLDKTLLKNIKRFALVESLYWELFVIIPSELFCKHNITNFSSSKFTANFYKCGDKLSDPHYITWNNIKTESPDYHRPEFFKPISFE